MSARHLVDDLQPEASGLAATARSRQSHSFVANDDDELIVLALDDDVDGSSLRPVSVAYDIRHGLAHAEPHVIDQTIARGEPGDDLTCRVAGFPDARRSRP